MTTASMRIAYFSPNYPGVTAEGGIGTYTRDLARTLVDRGHEVHVVTPGKPGTVEDRGVTVHLTDTRYLPIGDRLVPELGTCYRVSRALHGLVRKQGVEIVEFPNWEGAGLLFALWRSVPLVVRLSTSSLEAQQIDGTPPSRHAAWDVRREHWMSRRASQLVTHSRAHRQQMVEEIGVPAEEIRVSPLGIATFPDFVRPPSRSEALNVVYLGRLEKRKGTLDLLHAIPGVLAQVPSAQFTLIGADRPHCPGGRTHAQYIRETFPEQIQQHIHLAGRLSDAEVNRHLQTADVFVAPSLYESFGLIFVEAMRWGTPVIGARAGGIPEIVTDGETGLLVPPGDSAQLQQAILRMLQDEALRTNLGRAGRRHVEQEFSLEQMAQRAEDLYRDVLQARQRPAGRTASLPPARSSNSVPAGSP